MLSIVAFVILFGIALAQVPMQTQKPLLNVLDAALAVCMTIVR